MQRFQASNLKSANQISNDSFFSGGEQISDSDFAILCNFDQFISNKREKISTSIDSSRDKNCKFGKIRLFLLTSTNLLLFGYDAFFFGGRQFFLRSRSKSLKDLKSEYEKLFSMHPVDKPLALKLIY